MEYISKLPFITVDDVGSKKQRLRQSELNRLFEAAVLRHAIFFKIHYSAFIHQTTKNE